MQKPLDIVIAARAKRPVVLEQYPFDGWLFGVVLELAAPRERLVLEALAQHGEQSTEALILLVEGAVPPQRLATPHQMGAVLSRLRKLGLVWTIRSQGVAYHDLHGWARIGAPAWKAEQHAA